MHTASFVYTSGWTNNNETVRTNRDDDKDVFLRGVVVADEVVILGGSDGPCTTGSSVSLSSPKLVINCTTPGVETPGDLDRERDNDILHR